jgi:hypothetical protein
MLLMVKYGNSAGCNMPLEECIRLLLLIQNISLEQYIYV